MLLRSAQVAGDDDFTRRWGLLFESRAEFATFTHQEWVKWVKEHNERNDWSCWLQWIGERYGYEIISYLHTLSFESPADSIPAKSRSIMLLTSRCLSTWRSRSEAPFCIPSSKRATATGPSF